MTIKINGRTPEEIKKGLQIVNEHCLKVECSSSACPYYKECAPRTGMMREVPAQLVRDNISYIHQLEAERDQYKRERDAAVEDLRNKFFGCHTCKHLEYSPDGTRGCCTLPFEKRKPSFECWEWRGIEKEIENNE